MGKTPSISIFPAGSTHASASPTRGIRRGAPGRGGARGRRRARVSLRTPYKRDERQTFLQAFLPRTDFDDERYSPVFSPIARPGQTVKIRFLLERWEGQSVGVEGYVRDTFSKAEMIATRTIFPEEGKAYWLEFAIPDLLGSAADEVGLKLTSYSGKGKRDSGRLLVDRFSISGKARYAIDISRQTLEFGCVTPFSHDGGSWSLEAGRLHLMTPVRAASYTGGYRWAISESGQSGPLAGRSPCLSLRAGGRVRGYLGGFDQGV